ncbi:MAG: hypothetical protein ABSG70_02750 [Terriglobales bacterium]|jgi:hypothetical protein
MKMIWIAPLALVGIVLFCFIGGELVMHLWNWLLPPLFGWRLITFWQALAMLTLCRILFGRSGWHRAGRPNFRRRMRERWEGMTPEEREKFRHGMRGGCGPFGGASAAEPKPQP